jgi:hypothetical protein
VAHFKPRSVFLFVYFLMAWGALSCGLCQARKTRYMRRPLSLRATPGARGAWYAMHILIRTPVLLFYNVYM